MGVFASGGKRAIAIWHRRAGKDEVCAASHHVRGDQSVPEITGTAFRNLHRPAKAMWTAVNPHTGKRRIDEVFPQELRASTRTINEMFIRFINGSTWQCIGSDSVRHRFSSEHQRCRNCFLRICIGKPERVGVLPANLGGKQRLGGVRLYSQRTQSLSYSMFQVALSHQTGSANCSPQKILTHSPTKLLPKP